MQVNSKRERTNIFNTNTNWLLTLNCWREPIHVRARWFDLPNLVNFLLHILCFKELYTFIYMVNIVAQNLHSCDIFMWGHTHTRNLSYRIGINLNFRIVYKLNSTFTNGLNFVFKVKLVHIPFFFFFYIWFTQVVSIDFLIFFVLLPFFIAIRSYYCLSWVQYFNFIISKIG